MSLSQNTVWGLDREDSRREIEVDAGKMKDQEKRYEWMGVGWRVVPARPLFPCPLEVLRALGHPGDRWVNRQQTSAM